MKRVLRLLIICLVCAACALGLFACGGNGKSSTDEKGVICKKMNGDDFYTVIGYGEEEGVSSLDLSAAAKTKYGAETVVGRIRTGAFDGNNSLKEIIVGEAEGGVELTIDAGAFKNMRKLEKITLPFVGATAASDAYFNQTAPAVGDEKKATDKERSFGYIFGEEESDFAAGISFNYGSGSTTFYIPVTLNEITIESQSDINIPMYAFCGLTQVSVINLQGNIVAIGEAAFKNATQLSKINIPATVGVIYESAFEGATALKTFGEGFKFDDGSALTEIKAKAFKGTKLTNFVLPSGVTVIGEECFANSSLTAFTFSSALTEIGAYAFYNSKNLSVVVPTGITIGANAFAGTNVAT